jgi:hypothetical protein
MEIASRACLSSILVYQASLFSSSCLPGNRFAFSSKRFHLLQTPFHFSGKRFPLFPLAPNPFSLLRQAVSALFACLKPLFTSQASIFCSFRLPETPFHFSGKHFLLFSLAPNPFSLLRQAVSAPLGLQRTCPLVLLV